MEIITKIILLIMKIFLKIVTIIEIIMKKGNICAKHRSTSFTYGTFIPNPRDVRWFLCLKFYLR